MLKISALLLALAVLAGCASCPAPEPGCYTLVIACDGHREPVSVRRHWTETRPPSLEMLCYVKCAGTRACVSTDGCTWEVR